MDGQTTFLASVAKALAKTKSVLEFYKSCPDYAPAELDFEPYVGALFSICREHRKGFDGVDDLRQVLAVFERFRTHQREAGTDDAIAAAMESVTRYNDWLNATFPEVRQRGSSVVYYK